MLNPTLNTKKNITETSLTIDERTKKLFQAVYAEQNKIEVDDENIPKIKVSALISKMSFYYEKIRNTVEYKDEHLLRKNAVERILKREIIIQGVFQEVKTQEIAKHLLSELISAAYLPNNKLPESNIGDIALIIGKYLKLRRQAIGNYRDNEKKKELTRWTLATMAAEIEEFLGLSQVTENVVSYMYQVALENIALSEGTNFAKEKDIQIFLSIYRIYLKFDRDMLGHILLKYFVHDWKSISDERIVQLAGQLDELFYSINRQIDHPLTKKIDQAVLRYNVLFTILKDVIEDDPVGAYNNLKDDPKAFSNSIKRLCEKRYKATNATLWRAAVRSILYIFITKSILVFILEIPVTKILGEVANPGALAINVAFPPILLFLIVMFTKVPNAENTQKIIDGISEIVFIEKKKKDPYKVRDPIKSQSKLIAFFNLAYVLTFFVSFGFVVWILQAAKFNYISILIFIFFLAMVSFFSLRIRRRVRELIIVERKETLFRFLSDFFYTPIITTGKWIGERFSKINVFMFFMDFIIEAPFKIFVEVAEEWAKYVKERRDEIS
jgi:hypothetical protein